MMGPLDAPSPKEPEEKLIIPETLGRRERYQLLTTLVVPRPIGWISTQSAQGTPNLAPYSFFAAISSTPPLVAVSIGQRRGHPKDTLVNIREMGAFSVNVVSTDLVEAMNTSSADVPPDTDEFQLAGVTALEGGVVEAPYVAEAPAVLECLLFKEVDLGESASTLVIGEVKAVRLSPGLQLVPGSLAVDPESLKPVGRLGGEEYALPGEILRLPRPSWM